KNITPQGHKVVYDTQDCSRQHLLYSAFSAIVKPTSYPGRSLRSFALLTFYTYIRGTVLYSLRRSTLTGHYKLPQSLKDPSTFTFQRSIVEHIISCASS